MKRHAFVLVCIFVALFCSTTSAATRVRLATLAPRGTSYHQALQTMAENWRKAPEGGVALTIYPDGTMGSEADMVRRMRLGQLQAALLSVSGLAEIDPGVTALQYMPMMFRDLKEAEYVRQKLEPKLAERLNKKGFIVLFWGDAGWVRFFSRQQALRPNDFKVMRIFTLASGDQQQIDLMKELRFRPVPLEYSDVLTGLQTGMIDVVMTAPFHSLSGQFYTIAKHMLDLNWVPLVGAAVITQKAWDTLTPAQREAMLLAAVDAGKIIQARGRTESDEAVDAMKKRGLVVHPVPPDALAEWNKIVEGIYPKIRGGMVPADVFDEVRRYLAEYRGAHKSGSAAESQNPTSVRRRQ